MISFPFDSFNVGSTDSPIWDRPITSSMERKLNKACWSNGVFATSDDALLVTKGYSPFSVEVKKGGCHIEGARAYEDGKTLTISKPDIKDRIDRVIVRYDNTDTMRKVYIYVKRGVANQDPQPPALIRSEDVYELSLADVRVRAKTEEIKERDITDTRLNKDVCGFVVPAIPKNFDEGRLWEQIKKSIDEAEEIIKKLKEKEEGYAGDLEKLRQQVAGHNVGLEVLRGQNKKINSKLETQDEEIKKAIDSTEKNKSDIAQIKTDIKNLPSGGGNQVAEDYIVEVVETERFPHFGSAKIYKYNSGRCQIVGMILHFGAKWKATDNNETVLESEKILSCDFNKYVKRIENVNFTYKNIIKTINGAENPHTNIIPIYCSNLTNVTLASVRFIMLPPHIKDVATIMCGYLMEGTWK